MLFENLLAQLDKLDLPSDQYAITSSGALAVRKIREAHDLDIIVTDKLWNEFVQKYPVKKGQDCDNIFIGDIQIMGNFYIKPEEDKYPVNEQIDTADIIEGKRYVNLNIIKFYKQQWGRPKDLQDIKMIDNYLKLNK